MQQNHRRTRARARMARLSMGVRYGESYKTLFSHARSRSTAIQSGAYTTGNYSTAPSNLFSTVNSAHWLIYSTQDTNC